MILPPPISTLFPYTTLFRSVFERGGFDVVIGNPPYGAFFNEKEKSFIVNEFKSYQYKFESYIYFYEKGIDIMGDRKSTRLNSSHVRISYAVFCLKKKKKKKI